MSDGLGELAWTHGSDKGSGGGHNYTPHYAARFESLRHKPIAILEIGAGERNNSYRMWRDYFPQARIFGIEFDPPRVLQEERIKVFEGDQKDQDFLRTVVAETGPLDIVIDDGTHRGLDHVLSYEVLWPVLVDGGWYAIEDCQSLTNPCWTQPEDRTILHLLHERDLLMLVGQGDIQEYHVIGDGRADGLIFIKKRKKL